MLFDQPQPIKLTRDVGIFVRYGYSLLMHICLNDYIVHNCRISVRYMGTVPRHTLINYCTVPYSTYNEPYNSRTLYGPIAAMISSKGDSPKAFYFINQKIICYSLQKKIACEGGGAANALLLLPLMLRFGWRGPFAVWGFSGGKQL